MEDRGCFGCGCGCLGGAALLGLLFLLGICVLIVLGVIFFANDMDYQMQHGLMRLIFLS